MDLETIQSEVHKIADIVDEWSDQDRIPSLERDLVLEKLMSLYDMVRFSAKRVEMRNNHKSHSTPRPEERVVMQTLDIAAGAVTAPAPSPAVEQPLPADGIAVITPSAEERELSAEIPTAPQTEELHEEITLIESAPAVVESAPQATASGHTTQPVVAKVAEPDNLTPASSEADDALARHKMKQRMILSLYDNEETAPVTPAASPAATEENDTAAQLQRMGFLTSEQSSAYDTEESGEEDETTDDSFELISVEESTPAPAAATPEAAAAPVETPAPTAAPLEPTDVVTPQPAVAAPVREETPLHEEAATPSVSQPAKETPAVAAAAEENSPREMQPVEETAPAATPAAEAHTADPLADIFATASEDEDEEEEIDDEQAFSMITPDRETPRGEEEDEEDAAPQTLGDLLHDREIPEGAVLGDVINADIQTLGDSIQAPHDTISEQICNDRTTDLMQAIGINDKFLMIHDLFGGDSEAYDRVIGVLNAMDNLDDCLIYIAENFTWNPNTEGAKLLEELLERKFS